MSTYLCNKSIDIKEIIIIKFKVGVIFEKKRDVIGWRENAVAWNWMMWLVSKEHKSSVP